MVQRHLWAGSSRCQIWSEAQPSPSNKKPLNLTKRLTGDQPGRLDNYRKNVLVKSAIFQHQNAMAMIRVRRSLCAVKKWYSRTARPMALCAPRLAPLTERRNGPAKLI